MYNFLLTDDEKIVIDTISLIIRRNFGDEVQIFTALSGSSALDMVRKEKIDIMFMDIHMPGINGLETIKLIKQMNPNVVVIILSAYDQFEYAQEAINLGAFKYLTKPVNRNLIVQTIRNAMNLVDDLQGNLSSNIEICEKLNFVSSIVESEFIYSCIFNNSSTNDLSAYLNYFNIQDSSYFMCCIEMPESMHKSRFDSYVKLRDILTSKCRCIIGSFMNNRVGVYVPVPPADASQEDYRKTTMDAVHLKMSMELTSAIRIGVSDVESDISRTTAAYNNALSVLNENGENSGICYYGEHQKNQNAALASSSKQLSERILCRIKTADRLSLPRLVSEYVTVLYELYGDQTDRIKNCVFELVINARNCVLQMESTYTNSAFDTAFSTLITAGKREDIEKFMLDRCIECAVAIASIQENTMNPIIQKACAYMESHLSQELSLDQVSTYLNVSPYYLSKLFKEEKGSNFISYVTALRMEKAKSLLSDDKLIIKEISCAVGYSDQNYFSKLFKQEFGLTPSEYRDTLFNIERKKK